jgi:biopolymer transport protein ExbD
MPRRRIKHTSSQEVELNLAAMLDMAFQLLAFFILTFKPAQVEGRINLRLPPPVGLNTTGAPIGNEVRKDEVPAGLHTLTVTIFSKPDGSIHSLATDETTVGNLQALDNRLQTVLPVKDSPINQVIIQVGGPLRYDELMKVVEVCTRQTLADGQKLTKLSFVEAAGG